MFEIVNLWTENCLYGFEIHILSFYYKIVGWERNCGVVVLGFAFNFKNRLKVV